MSTLNESSNDVARGVGVPPIAPFSNLTATALGNICRVYETLAPNRDTLSILFSLDAAQTDPTDQWTTFFVETASAQLIWDERPTGSLNESDARWVIARFDEAPSVATIAILVRLVEDAQYLPAWFSAEVRQRAELFGSLKLRRERAEPKRRPHLRLVA